MERRAEYCSLQTHVRLQEARVTLRSRISTAGAAVLLLGFAGLAGAQSVTYSGQGVVVNANVLGVIDAAISDTGALPNSGGSLSTSLLNFQLPPILGLNLLSASTSGGNNQTNSQASVANVSLSVANVNITASVLTSNATALCSTSTASTNGNSTIADLKVNGLSVRISGAPNQTIPLLVGSLVINEQTSSVSISSSGNTAALTVNALHLHVDLLADVVISSSQAGVACTGGSGSGLGLQ
jgi:hypothetical protein